MASFWSYWVIVLTVVTIVGITWILFANRKREAQSSEKTTGHVYDDIEEYDNPLPAWWFYMFVITIVWGIVYLIIYPGMGNFAGVLGWTQIGQYEQQVAAADEKYRDLRDRYLALPVEEIAVDPAVRKMGMRMFANNCAQCHGADAKGAYGFPNLTDDDWIYGGDAATIKATLVNGRQAVMPAWGDVIGDKGIKDVTQYLLRLNGRDADVAQADAGETVFKTYCVACHGADGTGNQAMGAPNLTNGVWLYGGSEEQIAQTLRAWQSRNAEPLIDLRAAITGAKTMDDMSDLVAQKKGKAFFDALRDEMTEFNGVEERVMIARKAEAETTNSMVKYVIVGAAAIAVSRMPALRASVRSRRFSMSYNMPCIRYLPSSLT